MIKPYPSKQLHDRVDQFFNSITFQVRPEDKKRLARAIMTNTRYRNSLFVRQVIEGLNKGLFVSQAIENLQQESAGLDLKLKAKARKSAAKHLGGLLLLVNLNHDERGLIILEGLLNTHPSTSQDILQDPDPKAYLMLLLDKHRLHGIWSELNPFATALLICTPHHELIEVAKQKKRYARLLHDSLRDDRYLPYTQVEDDPLDVLPAPKETIKPHSAASWR